MKIALQDKLDVIECFGNPEQKLRIGEVLEKQKLLYQAMKEVDFMTTNISIRMDSKTKAPIDG